MTVLGCRLFGTALVVSLISACAGSHFVSSGDGDAGEGGEDAIGATGGVSGKGGATDGGTSSGKAGSSTGGSGGNARGGTGGSRGGTGGAGNTGGEAGDDSGGNGGFGGDNPGGNGGAGSGGTPSGGAAGAMNICTPGGTSCETAPLWCSGYPYVQGHRVTAVCSASLAGCSTGVKGLFQCQMGCSNHQPGSLLSESYWSLVNTCPG
jgi:hypothetical protein